MYVSGWCNREERKKTASDCLAELCEEAVTSSYWKRDRKKGYVECSEISEVLALVWCQVAVVIQSGEVYCPASGTLLLLRLVVTRECFI